MDDYQIDDTGLTGKEKCINDLLNSTNNPFIKDLLSQFEGNSEFNIKIVSENKVLNNGIEVNGSTTYNSNSDVITIKISTNNALNRSVLSVARTIIHEYIHADIYRKVYTKNTAPTGDIDFKTTYERYKSQIYKATVHHNTMAELYQKSIAATLKEFHITKMPQDRNYVSSNGTVNLDIYYDALSWQGIKGEHEAVWETVPEIRKQALHEALVRFDIASTKNCN